MPRQNRVTPFGEIIATPERGMFMGNRGLLHDSQGRIQRTWKEVRWIICLLNFKGRQRQLMTPGQYTELFFLDEATALAAGHRPCAECRRDRYNDFRKAWQAAHAGTRPPTAVEMDRQLHAERIASDRSKRSFLANLKDLPNGVFVRYGASGENAYLLWNDKLVRWTATGYKEEKNRPIDLEVMVLTPESTVRTIQSGFLPEIHSSMKAPE
jgi:hypothetical protein